ncbi:MAG: DUF6483 family protein [Verrucomicrobiota bacterium]
MIRRDYLLRMIEEFIRAMARINAAKKGQQWNEATGEIDQEFARLIGAGPDAVSRLSETELLARLMADEPTQAVRDKTLMLAALLKEAGDVAAAQGEAEESHARYAKGLHLLLYTLGRGEVFECPEFVPTVEVFVHALRDAPLSLRTRVLLMEHYERCGEFARAEDEWYAILEHDRQNAQMLEFGVAFYERLLRHSDAALAAGNLPRAEVEQALADLKQAMTSGHRHSL